MTVSGDRSIKIWAVSNGSCFKTFKGHTSSVLRASFLSHGTQFVSCGGAGLVKLWTIKSNECIATNDQHEGKEEAILRGQEPGNVYQMLIIIQLAFELQRPHKPFELFSQLCRIRDTEDPIEKALSSLGKEELHVLLEYVREWNTKPKLCHVAQSVPFWIFNIFPPTEIMEIKGVTELLEGLIPYSQRHFSRIDRLVRSTFLLDYILTKMSVIDPETGILPTKDQSMLLSENGLQVEQGLPKVNDQMDVTYESGHNDQILVSELEEKVASKKRKASKSKRGSQKKVKVASHEGGSVISVKAFCFCRLACPLFTRRTSPALLYHLALRLFLFFVNVLVVS